MSLLKIKTFRKSEFKCVFSPHSPLFVVVYGYFEQFCFVLIYHLISLFSVNQLLLSNVLIIKYILSITNDNCVGKNLSSSS